VGVVAFQGSGLLMLWIIENSPSLNTIDRALVLIFI
jgi:hypothetical protein